MTAVSCIPTSSVPYSLCQLFCLTFRRPSEVITTSPSSRFVHGVRTVAARIVRCFLLLPMYMCRYNRLYLSDLTRSNFVINPFALTGRIFACVSIYIAVCVCGCARAVGVCPSLFPAFPIRAVPFCPVCAYPTLCISSYTVLVSLSRCT